MWRRTGVLLLMLAACGDEPADPETPGGGGASASSVSASTSTSGGGGQMPLEPPADLERYLTGADADADVTPAGPGLILMGGGADVDAAFAWQRDRIAGGDVVVIRTSGSDGYNDYLFSDIGGVDSVETLLVTSRALADDPWVAQRVAHAEAVFMAGGDQATYLRAWKDSALAQSLMEVYQRGGVLGGTSAGCAVLGQVAFAAYEGTVYSDEVLMNPYVSFVTLERDFLSLPPLAGVITDSHFAERDRFGRLLGFMARAVRDGWLDETVGLGFDEATAMVVDASGQGEVLGAGAVYAVSGGAPMHCEPGVPLQYEVTYRRLVAGDSIALPAGTTSVAPQTASAAGGSITPSDPY